jgi:hypothetical protein
MWQQWRSAFLLPAAIFLALLLSSPYILAYASVTMTEIAGAAAQLAVLVAYVAYRQRPTASTARAFAISLTILFFTKYNYFVLLVVPLVFSEWLERSSPENRIEQLRSWSRRALSSPTMWVLAVYVVGLLVVMTTGGFEFRIAAKRISIHTVGNSGHVVLYGLLARLWYLHSRGRIAWRRIVSTDPRVPSFLVWFALPVTVWLASPYPNHIRDFFNLVINRPLGEATIGAGTTVYVEALRELYFYREGVLIGVICVFAIAAFNYRRQAPLMRWLILAIPVQFSAIALHQTRFPRFLLLTVVVLCIAAACETGRWIAGSRVRRIIAAIGAPLMLGAGVLAANSLVVEGRFHDVAFENYTDNQMLGAALDSIRADLVPADRLAIVGQSNELSPALFRWELGPPSGLACSPFEVGGARGIDLSLATRVLLLMPLDPSARLDVTTYYVAQRAVVLEQSGSGHLEMIRELPLADMHVGLRFYRRTSRPIQQAPCR